MTITTKRPEGPVQVRTLTSSSIDTDCPHDRYFFSADRKLVYRDVTGIDGSTHRTHEQIEPFAAHVKDPHEAFDLAWLNRNAAPGYHSEPHRIIRLADLFCGAGGMTLGVIEAARALGMRVECALGADMVSATRRAYQANFKPSHFIDSPIESVLDGDPQLILGTSTTHTRLKNRALTRAEGELRARVGEIDIVVGGPPCQGHSNLNNHTRRNDPKNSLYGRMARFAHVFEPEHLIIENVHGAKHDQSGIMDRTRDALAQLGYSIDTAIVHGEMVGVPQTRHRIFMVASRSKRPNIQKWEERHKVTPRSFDWSQTGLQSASRGVLDTVTTATKLTQSRIDWLFRHEQYDLPNEERPACHRDKAHSYQSVYGRIHPDRPAPTITTGFTVMGQGRFVHPHEPRTLTPREGARLQFFPSWFSFGEVSCMTRKELVSLIGNAVPPKMAYVLALELFR